jgi:DNA-binding NarL/FixJ family response regulator
MADARRCRVLLVDDYVSLLAALERLLAPHCDVVGSVRDGTAVLEASRRLRPDVIVLDLNIPGVHGLDLCREIRRENDPARVILLSADVDSAVRRRAMSLGASAVISKHQVTYLLLPSIKQAYGDFPSSEPT